MSTVDNRVVNMEFNNRNFASKISDTITSQAVLTPQITQLSLGNIQGWVSELNTYISQIEQIKNQIIEDRKEQSLPKEYDIREVIRSFTSYLV